MENTREMKADGEDTIKDLEKNILKKRDPVLHHQLIKAYYNAGEYEKAINTAHYYFFYYGNITSADEVKQLLEQSAKKLEAKEKEQTERIQNENEASIKEKEDIKAQEEEKVEDDISANEGLRELHKLVGLNNVKEDIDSMLGELKMQKIRQKENLKVMGHKGQHLLLLGNPGTGKSALSSILAKIYAENGLLEDTEVLHVTKNDLVGQYIGHTENKTTEILDKARGKMLFIDEAYTLYIKDSERDFGKIALETIMERMEKDRDQILVVMAGYKNEMEEMLSSNPGLKSRFMKTLYLEDYTEEELLDIGEKMAKDQDYYLTKEATEAFKDVMRRKKLDETFGNAREARTLIEQAIKNQLHRLSKAHKNFEKRELMELRAEDIDPKGTYRKNRGEQYYKNKLNQLIGLKAAKEQVKGMINRVEMNEKRKKFGDSEEVQGNHMMFLGNPGTGKTTVARIIGEIYNELGVLKRGDRFIECSREDFLRKGYSEVSAEVKEMVKKAKGGILFIDEAYNLYKDDYDSIGKEMITTLIREMENERENLVVILAGYSKEMGKLLKSNTGLASRIPYSIEFEDYTPEELVDIFLLMCENQRVLTTSSKKALETFVLQLWENRGEDFGNAREIRNYYIKTKDAQDQRLSKMKSEELDKSSHMTLEKEDIINAFKS